LLDLGAGTGLATLSILGEFPIGSAHLVDPDPRMLAVAERDLLGKIPEIEFQCARSDDFRLPVGRFDLVLIGSAWHWMDAGKTTQKLETALEPGGSLLVFESQFPKLEFSPEVQDWVRREFNLRWRASGQEPRGALSELLAPLRKASAFSEWARLRLETRAEMELAVYEGLLRSQSRYLAYEESLSSERERMSERERVASALTAKWGVRTTQQATTTWEAFLFRKRFG
jgi:ubiquinone/menaquinone biosynthesis C-methylase UbiE